MPLVVNLSGNDPDGTTLSFSIVNAPAVATVEDNPDGTGTFRWTPDEILKAKQLYEAAAE